ncbi:23S rRNA (adenine(2030)-N(6))-methyltransferase RlmJ [Maricaulis sp.]|uniref:23S rRNA (adenine(2030)-N(6))-methyltransferase RlmJ n=1 Tax=Maricaulis sp. TaxID=1486257 RepID=UPI001AFFBE92|nr:23S rRNA (adenine(2030)-N(6))-methyltransferase RlmJ [Maricaulis sp.]MBO6797298.1 23S rRNA (adenine(2030)-N(6))-methyltransferase RlmJ [Maricaulis sp.]
MNYRHAFHAGNFADILKHLVLAKCVEHLNAKPKPYRYIDTHSGIGGYDLAGDEAARSPEWKDGIGRLINAELPDAVESLLAPYLGIIRDMNEGDTLRHYPGSPEIATRLMREGDRLHLCELHPQDSETLDARYKRDKRVRVEQRDGYKALKSLVPPPEKRGLVLIDPPFEDKDELAHMAEAVMAALDKWPTGTFVFWRSLKNLWAADRFDNGLAEWLISEKQLAPEKILRADLWIRDLASEGKLAGAGVVVINPPWTLEEKLVQGLPWIADTLAQGDGYGWRVDGALTDEDLEDLAD